MTGTKEIEGAYWDSESGLYLAIDSKKIRGGLVSPYLGGKALTQLGRLERTGENTYTVSGNFSAIQGECSGSVRFNLTKLSDGNLLFEAVSPEEVFAIIFGSCRWKGTLTSRAELRQIHR
ncbi:MAG: hypothetical protein HYR96_11990 [Deltaproteobacteria bacterium]|nr:hypothetical protein [Deltaproteobacteria bacterium]